MLNAALIFCLLAGIVLPLDGCEKDLDVRVARNTHNSHRTVVGKVSDHHRVGVAAAFRLADVSLLRSARDRPVRSSEPTSRMFVPPSFSTRDFIKPKTSVRLT